MTKYGSCPLCMCKLSILPCWLHGRACVLTCPSGQEVAGVERGLWGHRGGQLSGHLCWGRDACGTRRSKHCWTQDGTWQFTAGADHGQELAEVPGVLQHTWGAGSFVDMLENNTIHEQPHKPWVAAGIVGNHHFVGIKVIVFCSS